MEIAQKHKETARFYNINSILGNNWAIFFAIIGPRMTGKSYSVTDFLCNRHKKLGDQCKNYWLRISETSTKALLMNKADKLVDPDLKRKYDLEFKTKGEEVFNKGKNFMTVIPLSKFGKLKGVGYFDKDFKGEYNIVLDEFQLEQGEKRTSFDILYNFIGMIENIARTTKQKIRVFLLGNTLEEASAILKAFNFIPEKFGRFYLHSKKCVIDNIEPTKEYLADRKGSIADILGGNQMSNFSNTLQKNISSIYKGRCIKPTAIMKFYKDSSHWYTIWDNGIIKRYNKETTDSLAMRPYLDLPYNPILVKTMIDLYDNNGFLYNSLITKAYFEAELQLLRK